MWRMLPKYPVLPDRPRITNQKQLPSGVRLLGRMPREANPKEDYYFCENNGGLSILIPDDLPFIKTKPCSGQHKPDIFKKGFSNSSKR